MNRMLMNELIKNQVGIKRVPNNKRPTAESLERLENEISSKISSNEYMRNKNNIYPTILA